MRLFKIILSVLVAGFFGCVSGSESGGIETGNAGSNLAAAVGSLFSSDDEPAGLKTQSDGEPMGPRSACETIEDGPSGVTTSASIVAGTYGKSDNAVTLSASDGCDQGGEFASFLVSSHNLTCSSGDGSQTILTMEESSGVFRENLELDRTEIYGTFNLTDGTNVATAVRCSLTIDRNQQFGGGCEDASGAEIEQSSETVCVDNE